VREGGRWYISRSAFVLSCSAQREEIENRELYDDSRK
jgi:hypothetical protein